MIRGLEGRCGGPGPSAGPGRTRRLWAGCHPLTQAYIGTPMRVYVENSEILHTGAPWQVGKLGHGPAVADRPMPPSLCNNRAMRPAEAEVGADSFPQVGEDPEADFEPQDYDLFFEVDCAESWVG